MKVSTGLCFALAMASLVGCQAAGTYSTPAAALAAVAPVPEQNYADEATDWGIEQPVDFRTGDYHQPTPIEAPGVLRISTSALSQLIASSTSPVLIDVLEGNGHNSLPGAVWLPGGGRGFEVTSQTQERFVSRLVQLTDGDMDKTLVFFCLGPDCWLSWNAAVRAAELGYTDVRWYRGGVDAWRAAGLPFSPATQPAAPAD